MKDKVQKIHEDIATINNKIDDLTKVIAQIQKHLIPMIEQASKQCNGERCDDDDQQETPINNDNTQNDDTRTDSESGGSEIGTTTNEQPTGDKPADKKPISRLEQLAILRQRAEDIRNTPTNPKPPMHRESTEPKPADNKPKSAAEQLAIF